MLEGGLLLAAFDLRRATRDVDLLALRTDNDPKAVERLVVEVASVEVEDGVVFLPDTIAAQTIRDGDVYPGGAGRGPLWRPRERDIAPRVGRRPRSYRWTAPRHESR